jgi:TPR repeat protein
MHTMAHKTYPQKLTTYPDVDAVYRIAFMLMVLPKGQLVLEWTRNACAQAKSRRALTEVVNRYIEIPVIDIHRNNEWIATVKDFALVDGYPQAIMLYAKILTWRGETAQAASLMEKEILPYISPVARKPVVWKDLTLYGTMDSPLRLYSLAIADTKGIAAAAELVRRAAIEYAEPIALTEIAIAQLETNNFEKYEEYMTMAASAGYGNACYHLANYYYRVSTGEFASAEEEAVKRKQARSAEGAGLFGSLDGIREWAGSLVHKPLTRKDYLKLASEWYNVAFATGVSNAGFILALISRNAGDLEESRMMYDAVPQENLLKYLPAKALRELDTRWDDPTFEPGLPPKLLRLG